MDHNFWAEYWRAKARKEEADKCITAKERRAIRKEAKKQRGAKRVRTDEKIAALKEIYSHLPICVKNGDWCDKKNACDVLGQCIVTISRVQANPELMDALKGPKSVKTIIRLLAKHDREPMKSYYR